MTALLMDLSMYTAAIDALLLIVLLAVYLRVYRDTHAQFSLGLSIFSVLLLGQNLLAVYSFLTMASFIERGDQFLPYLFTINLAEAFGTLVLLRTTTR